MSIFRTNLAIIPEVSTIEKIILIIIIAIMIIPFFLGVISGDIYLFLSLPIGLVLLKIFGEKFKTENWIQKTGFIEFTFEGITILDNSKSISFDWNSMKDIFCLIISYAGEQKDNTGESFPYNGTENKIQFIVNDITYEFNFYLKNLDNKNRLQLLMKNLGINSH